MSVLATYFRPRISWGVTLLTAGLLALLLFSTHYSFVSAGPQFRLVGTILAASTTPTGIGTWTIRQDDQGGGAIYTVKSDQNTTFDNGLPVVGQQVEVRGELQWNNKVLASRIRSVGGGGGGQEIELKGLVLIAPPGHIGQWVIQLSQPLTQTIVTDNATIFDRGAPVVGQWMEVKASPQADGTFLAKRLRPDDFETNEIVVRLVTNVLSSTIASRYDLVPQSTLLASGHIYLFTTADNVEQTAVQAMAADPDVIWAELNFIGRIPTGNPARTFRWGGSDPTAYINQSAFTQIDLAPALLHYDGAGSVVAVLDTGIDLNHPALVGHLISGWDMVADDDTPQDEGTGLGWGHGTHIAGIIAHMAPSSQIMPVRVLDSNGRGNTFTLAYAIDWAVSHGANVINLSLGADADSHVLHEAIDRALTHNVIVVAAAGNDNSDVPQYPVSYAGVLGVTAVDSANVKADFANFGRGWVDLAAPGVGITSTMVNAEGSGYASWSGTSMATSFVSGAAALVHQKFSQASPVAIAQVLRTTATNLNGLNPTYFDKLGGLLDVGAALAATVVATSTPTSEATPTFTPTDPPSPSGTATPIPGAQQPYKFYLPVVKKRKSG